MKKSILYLFAILITLFTSVTPVAAEDFTTEKEPNNSIATANLISATDIVQGTLENNQDQDFFKMVLTERGQFFLLSMLGNDSEEGAIETYYDEYYLELYDEKGNLITKGKSDGEDLYYYYFDLLLEKGTYYVAIKPVDGTNLVQQEYILISGVVPEPTVTVNFDLPSPQAIGNKISIQADSKPGELEYQFSINNKVVKEFSNAKTYSWQPTEVGTYTIKVEARDPGYPSLVGSKEVSYEIKQAPKFKIKSFKSNKSPQIAGKKVTFKALTNKTGLAYQFYINNKVVREFDKSNTFSWKPSTVGKYKVRVEVMDPRDPDITLSKTLTHEVKSPKVKISKLSTSVASPRPIDTKIKLSAKADGVDLEYKFSYYYNNRWTTLQNYSSKNSVDWKPQKSGTYKIRVEVVSKASGKKATKSASYTIFKPASFSVVSLSPSKNSPEPIESIIKFTAKTKGKNLEYRFRINDQGDWYVLQDWSSKNTVNWKPNFEGKYIISVDVRQAGTHTVKSKTISYEIK